MLGVVLSIILVILFLNQFINFVSAVIKAKTFYILVHLLGAITTAIVGMFSIAATIGADLEISNTFVTITVVLAFIFFVALGYDSLRVERMSRRHRNIKDER